MRPDPRCDHDAHPDRAARPTAPGSLVRSSTAIAASFDGSAATKAGASNGRNSRTLQQPDPLACGDQRFDRFLGRPRGRTHEHDHALGIGCAAVLEQPVAAPGELAEAVHGFADDAGTRS